MTAFVTPKSKSKLLGLKVLLLALVAIGLGSCKGEDSAFSDLLGSGDGGTGNSSIAINSFSPTATNYVMKKEQTVAFLVSAVGKGDLSYSWTLDGVATGTNSPTISLIGPNLSVGSKKLKVTITDTIGSTSQEWTVKVNGTPVLASAVPTMTAYSTRKNEAITFSVSMTDPNNDTLSYAWKLNGDEAIFTSTTNSQSWTPTTSDVGVVQTVSVDVYDGTVGESGTYRVTRTWQVTVNHFSEACNRMDNLSQTNKSCVYVGIAGVGDGLAVASNASSYMMRPTALARTSSGNIFIADNDNNVIWFYNRSTTTSATMFGVTVPAGTMKVVAGTGLAINGLTASALATRTGLNDPRGMFWDGTFLWVTEQGNSDRVIRIEGTTGTVTRIFNSGTPNCDNPAGITKIGTTLYVACSSRHTIISIDVSGTTYPVTGTIFAGVDNSQGDAPDYTEDTFTVNDSRLRTPYGLVADSNNNLIVSENGGCRVRYYNRASNPDITVFSGNTISLNATRLILGPRSGGCGDAVAVGTGNTTGSVGTARVRGLRHLELTSGGLLLVPSDTIGRVHALNLNAAGSVTFFGISVSAGSYVKVLGVGTTGNDAGYNGHGLAATSTSFNLVMQTLVDSTSGHWFLADYGNRRMRAIDSSDNTSYLVAGNGSFRPNTNNGQGNVYADEEKLSQPRGMVYDSVNKATFISDSLGYRIRVLDRFGVVSQAVGTGTTSGTGAEEDELPTNSTMNQARGVALVKSTTTFGGHLVWADSQNHRIRIWNRETVSRELFGVTVAAGKVATIAGNGTSGNFWQISQGTAVSGASLNEPSGVAWDGTYLYISDRGNHCVKRLHESGTDKGKLEVVVGDCDQASGVAGNGDGIVGTASLNAPEGIAYYSSGTSSGLLIASTGGPRLKFHRLGGSSGTIFGSYATLNSTTTLACAGTVHAEGAPASDVACSGLFDVSTYGSTACFANSNYHNVRCMPASTGVVTTLAGVPQGSSVNALVHYPGQPFASGEYDSATPNYTTQNNVPAFFVPTPADAPAMTDIVTVLNQPRTVLFLDATTVLISDLSGLIRKVKLP